MKPIMNRIMMLAFLFTTFTLSAFAFDPIDKINEAVTQSFNKDFKMAQHAEWTIKADFIRVKFMQDGQTMYAYYTESGELIAVTRNISKTQLPIALSASIQEKYPDYYMADLFEVLKDGNSIYYAQMRKGNSSVTLEAVSSGSWRVFKKQNL